MRILDLCCCEGIGADGYRAVFGPDVEIVGVDIIDQPNYPHLFIHANALDVDPRGFDFVHASPPCQAKTTMSNRHRGAGGKADSHSDYIAAIRWHLMHAGVPYVIENVPGARKDLHDPITLNGGMFGLGVDRPRLFEATFSIPVPPRRKVVDPLGVYGKAPDGRRLFTRKDGSIQRAASSVDEAKAAMGIPAGRVVSWRGVAESIPPAYTEHIGRALLAHLATREEAA